MSTMETFGHPAGLCVCAWLPDGKRIYSGGSDGLVRSFSIVEDQIVSTTCVDDRDSPITAISFTPDGGSFAIGTVDHEVCLFSTSSSEFCSNITRLTGVVTSIAFDKSSSSIAVAGDETSVKLLDTSDPSATARILAGAKSAIQHIAIDPSGQYLAGSAIDGQLIVWKLIESVPVITRVVSCLTKTKVGSNIRLRCDWSIDKLAVPAGIEINVLEMNSFKKSFVLKGSHSDQVSLVSWSPNGRYLASAGLDLKLYIWDASSHRPVAVKTLTHVCSDMQWCPTENSIAYTTFVGTLGVWLQPVPKHLPSPSVLAANTATLASPFSANDSGNEENVILNRKSSSERDEEEENAEGIEDENDDEMDSDGNRIHKRRRLLKLTEKIDADLSRESSDDDDRDSQDMYDDYREPRYPQSGSYELQQPAVYPGCTRPQSPSFLLTWNSFGSIESFDGASGGQATAGARRIQVDFADSDANPRIRITDRYNFTIAALGHNAILLSAPSGHGRPSTIFYRPLNSWASNSDWTSNLPLGEDPCCLAVGNHFASIGSDKGVVRVLSFTGVHKTIFSLKGPIVNMTGFGDSLIIIYNGRSSRELMYMMFDCEAQVRLSSGDLPLSESAVLSWVAFSDDGIPMVLDSTGILRGLFTTFGISAWVPLLDCKSLPNFKRQTVWPIKVFGNTLLGFALKAGQKEPCIRPRPVMASWPLSIPLIISDAESMGFEKKYVQSRLSSSTVRGLRPAQVDRATAEQDRSVIEMIMLACKSDNPVRALDLASCLILPKSMQLATKIVQSMNQPILVQRMTLLFEAKFSKDPKSLTPPGSLSSSPSTSNLTSGSNIGKMTISPAPTSLQSNRAPSLPVHDRSNAETNLPTRAARQIIIPDDDHEGAEPAKTSEIPLSCSQASGNRFAARLDTKRSTEIKSQQPKPAFLNTFAKSTTPKPTSNRLLFSPSK